MMYIFNWMWSSRGLPPGPPCFPLVGSLLSFMGSSTPMQMTLKKLAKTYGDVFTVFFPTGLKGSKPTIIINSFVAARDALVTQKDAFSGRPYLFTFNMALQGGEGLGFSDFTSRTKLMRKVVHSAIRLYHPHLEEKVLEEANDIVERFSSNDNCPFNPRKDLSLAIYNVIFAIIYGKRFDPTDEEFLKHEGMSEEVNKLLSPTHILNFFPWLFKLHIPSFKRIVNAFQDRSSVRERRYFEAKETFQENQIRHLVDALLQAKFEEERDSSCLDKLRDKDLTATINTLFGAGGDTTATTLGWLIAYLMNFPHIQEKLYAEIMEVFGKEGRIELKKKRECHYLEATLTEVLRQASVLPVFPHKTTCDTTLSGFKIPKETSILLNYWAINNDERQWENPNQFNPDRFIDSEGKFTGTTKMSYMPFGAGRRTCSGESLSKTELFLFSATLLKNFKFETPRGLPPPDLTNGKLGITYAPKPYKVVARRR